MSKQPTVSDIFRRAQAIRAAAPNGSFTEVKEQIVSEYSAQELPAAAYLTIPELDEIAPQEDWTAGLPIVLRGIQNDDWQDVALGVIICLEQVENYPKESGREDAPEKNWRNRHKGIAEEEEKNMSKWMPDDLMNLARKNVKS